MRGWELNHCRVCMKLVCVLQFITMPYNNSGKSSEFVDEAHCVLSECVRVENVRLCCNVAFPMIRREYLRFSSSAMHVCTALSRKTSFTRGKTLEVCSGRQFAAQYITNSLLTASSAPSSSFQKVYDPQTCLLFFLQALIVSTERQKTTEM